MQRPPMGPPGMPPTGPPGMPPAGPPGQGMAPPQPGIVNGMPPKFIPGGGQQITQGMSNMSLHSPHPSQVKKWINLWFLYSNSL